MATILPNGWIKIGDGAAHVFDRSQFSTVAAVLEHSGMTEMQPLEDVDVHLPPETRLQDLVGYYILVTRRGFQSGLHVVLVAPVYGEIPGWALPVDGEIAQTHMDRLIPLI